MAHGDELIGRCENRDCTGEMGVAPSDPGKALLVTWTWSDGESSLQAVFGRLLQRCPRCGMSRNRDGSLQ
jgi:hypothetical protein